MRVSHGGGESVRRDLGVFLLETPRWVGDWVPAAWTVEGYDLLSALDVPVARSWQVASQTVVVDAAAAVLVEASVGAPVGIERSVLSVTPHARLWPLSEDTTWLTIADDLLSLVAYGSVFVDRAGQVVSRPFVVPSERSPTRVYDTTRDDTVVAAGPVREEDTWGVPNRWVIYRDVPSEGAPAVGAGMVVRVNQSDGPTSMDERGRTVSRVVAVDAVDEASLEVLADRIVAQDRRPALSLRLRVLPDPGLWHGDVVEVRAPEVGVTAATRFAVKAWDLPLDGSDMTVDLEAL